MTENETSNHVLQYVKSIIEESRSEIPDVAIDRAHWIDKAYSDKTSVVYVKAILFGFDFRHRPMIYHNRKNMKRDVKVKLDFTKKRYSIFTEAMQWEKEQRSCQICNGWY